MDTLDQAVILARGLGTRMRRLDPAARLDPSQSAAADTGIKTLISVGRPFLDYLLANLADTGYRRICLVIGPEHDAIRAHCAALNPRRISLDFAIQQKPRGTADAVAAAESFTAGRPFIVLNSDNLYPTTALQLLRQPPLDHPALIAFDRDALLTASNIPEDRLTSFALIQPAPDGTLVRIIEKPSASLRPQSKIENRKSKIPSPSFGISMNCWRFTPAIFAACRAIPPSPRGELELPDAVQYSIDHLNQHYTIHGCRDPVLDLSTRADIAAVTHHLAGRTVDL